MRDAADLDARAVVAQRFLQLRRSTVRLLRFSSMSMKSMTISPARSRKPQLARDLFGGLAVGLERGVLDVVLARGAARVDVDRDQRLGLVDHDVAAGAKLHDRLEHGVELALDAVAREHRQRVVVALHVAWHGSA